MSELEKRHLELVKLWAETYNNDVDSRWRPLYHDRLHAADRPKTPDFSPRSSMPALARRMSIRP
jgi:hypothetical protein